MAVTRFKSEPRAPLPRVMSETTTRPAMTVRSPSILRLPQRPGAVDRVDLPVDDAEMDHDVPGHVEQGRPVAEISQD